MVPPYFPVLSLLSEQQEKIFIPSTLYLVVTVTTGDLKVLLQVFSGGLIC